MFVLFVTWTTVHIPQSSDEEGLGLLNSSFLESFFSLRCALIWASQFRKQGTRTILSATLIHWRYIYPFINIQHLSTIWFYADQVQNTQGTHFVFFLFFLFCVYLKAHIKVSELLWTKSSRVEAMNSGCYNFKHKTVKTEMYTRVTGSRKKQNHDTAWIERGGDRSALRSLGKCLEMIGFPTKQAAPDACPARPLSPRGAPTVWTWYLHVQKHILGHWLLKCLE
jgi:hypothetical protein